jgi:hypothetical protein
VRCSIVGSIKVFCEFHKRYEPTIASCNEKYCALWDADSNQCAVKTALITHGTAEALEAAAKIKNT